MKELPSSTFIMMQDSNSKQTAQRPEVLHWSQIPNGSTKTWFFFPLDYLHTFWGQCTSAAVRLVLTRATSSISNRWYEGFVFTFWNSGEKKTCGLLGRKKKAHWTIDDCSCIYERNSHIVLAFWTFEVEYKLSTHSTTLCLWRWCRLIAAVKGDLFLLSRQ